MKATQTAYISQYADEIDRQRTIESMKHSIEVNLKAKVTNYDLLVVDPRRGFKDFFPAETYIKAKNSKLVGLVMTAQIERL